MMWPEQINYQSSLNPPPHKKGTTKKTLAAPLPPFSIHPWSSPSPQMESWREALPSHRCLRSDPGSRFRLGRLIRCAKEKHQELTLKKWRNYKPEASGCLESRMLSASWRVKSLNIPTPLHQLKPHKRTCLVLKTWKQLQKFMKRWSSDCPSPNCSSTSWDTDFVRLYYQFRRLFRWLLTVPRTSGDSKLLILLSTITSSPIYVLA